MSTPAPLTADEIRTKIVTAFEAAKPALESYYAYAQTAAALAQEYHAARFRESFPDACQDEMTLICKVDSRETPKSLDVKLQELRDNGVIISAIIFDRLNACYYLFV